MYNLALLQITKRDPGLQFVLWLRKVGYSCVKSGLVRGATEVIHYFTLDTCVIAIKDW